MAGLTQWAALPDGKALAYDDYDFTDPWTSPETLVLVHGFSKNRRFWYQWIPVLARDYRVIRVDQRGHGESAAALSPDAEINFAAFAADMVSLLDAVGVEKAHFVMAELTTTVAVHLGAKFPDRVLSLVLPGSAAFAGRVTPRHDVATPRPEGDWSQLLREKGSEVWARTTNSVRLPADASNELKEWYISQQAQMDPETLIKVFQSSPNQSVVEWLSKIQAPTLLIGGSEAMHASPEDLYKSASMIPHCQVKILEGMPFNVMNAAPEACIEATQEFLRGLNPRS